MTNPRAIAFSILIFLTAQTGQLFAEEGDLWPGEVVTLMNHAMQLQPEVDRTTLTAPLIARMRTEGLSPTEKFLRGEAHFLNFEPEPARDIFWDFRERDDALGRVALQRLMIIRINAFEKADEIVEKDIPRYRERFPVSPVDRYGISYAVAQTARHYIANGKADLGLDLIVEEVNQHSKFDSAYIAYTLPGQFIESAMAAGRGEEFIQLYRWAISGLSKAIEARLENPPGKPEQLVTLPGTVFFSLFDDSDWDQYRLTGAMMRMRDQLVERGKNKS